jgi:ubiquitin
VRGGGSGFNIFINLKKDYNLEKENIKLINVYFNGGNCKLKKQSKSLYQGYIASTNNTIDIELDRLPKKVEKQNLKQDELSFNLAKHEAVICFVKNGTKRYQKINVNKQRLTNIPM